MRLLDVQYKSTMHHKYRYDMVQRGKRIGRGCLMAAATQEKAEAKTPGQIHIGCTVPTELYRQVKGILGMQGRTLREVVIHALQQVLEAEQKRP